MDHGVLLVQRRETDRLVEFAQLVEDRGFDLLGLNDSQAIFRELYVTLGVVADHTDHIPIGSTVTNPITRHPTVTASAICSLDELAGGRAFLGIGTGESAVKTIGKEPARLRDTRTYIETVRSLTQGKTVNHDGTEVKIRWVEENETTFDVPIFLSAAGPKTLEMAGAIADGVYIANGVSPDIVEDSIERIKAGAERAGRDPGEVAKWVFTKIQLAETKAAAMNEIRHALAASANFTFRNGNIPSGYESAIREFRDRYEPYEHEQPGATDNAALMEELGLTEVFADRFAVTGTPNDCLRQIEELNRMDEVDGLLYPALAEDDFGLVNQIGSEILPRID